MHESTVSRVTINKYLSCARGLFELKYFFSSGIAATDGDSAVSAEAVKSRIRALIDAEEAGAILSDETIAQKLAAEGHDSRSEERRGGKECVRTARSRGSPNH